MDRQGEPTACQWPTVCSTPAHAPCGGTLGYRGTLGLTPAGTVVLSRLSGATTLTRPDGAVVPIDEINTQFMNRNGWTAQVLLYTPRYPDTVTVPAGGVALTLAGLELRPNAVSQPSVLTKVEGGATGAPVAVPAGGGVIAAEAPARDQLDPLNVGDVVAIAPGIFALDGDPDVWSRVVAALPAGPYIVRDGARTRSDDWIGEGFSHERHNAPRTPRTAIGVRADGEILLVTVDGRQPGWSAGMNMWEFANLMVDLGAVEALSLDGGGSTTATLLGRVRNWPSDGVARPIANALVVRHTYPFAHSRQLGGRDRYDTPPPRSHGRPFSIRTSPPVPAATPAGALPRSCLQPAKTSPDALAGGPLAAMLDAPLLLTDSETLPAATLAVLNELGTTDVVLLGGEAAVSPAVAQELEKRGMRVERLRGFNRHATAAAIGARLAAAGRLDTIILASGGGFADALVAAAPAGRLGSPILLTGAGQLPEETASFLDAVAPQRIMIVGGTAVVSTTLETRVQEVVPAARVERLAGPDRYATAVAIADWAAGELGLGTHAVIARGDAFPDALAGGPFAASMEAPLMIVPPGNTLRADAASSAWLVEQADALDSVDMLGGSSVFSLYERVRGGRADQPVMTSGRSFLQTRRPMTRSMPAWALS